MNEWYGNFDILFPGASINCDNESKTRALKDYFNHKKDTFYVDLSRVEEEDERERLIWYNTTYFHEARHVHDYLLCPALNYEYRLRLTAIYQTLHLLFSKRSDSDYSVFPLPLQQWIRLPLSKKKECLNEWSDVGFKASAPLVSVPGDMLIRSALSNEAFHSLDLYSRLAILGAASFEEYSALHKRKIGDQYGRTISVKTMMEASAVACQLMSAYSLYGEEGEQSMWRLLVKAANAETLQNRHFNDYTVVFSYINAYLGQKQAIGQNNLVPFTGILMTWCFFANQQSDGRVDPVMRLREFIERDFAKDISIKHITDAPEEVFAYWDKKMGEQPFNINKYIIDSQEFYNELYERAKQFQMKELSSYVEMISKASLRMCMVYSDNPSKYILPEGYLERFFEFTNVPVKFYLNSDLMDYAELGEKVQYLDTNAKNRDNGATDSSSTGILSYDQPVVKVHANGKGQSSHVRLLSSRVSKSFQPYAKLVDSVYQPDSSKIDPDILETVVSPMQIRYLF